MRLVGTVRNICLLTDWIIFEMVNKSDSFRLLALCAARTVALDSGKLLRRERLPAVLTARPAQRGRFPMTQT